MVRKFVSIFSFLLFLGYSASATGISGTFIQYQTWMMQINEDKWRAELDAMRAAGIGTVVIQWLKSDQVRFFPINAPGNDPTEAILKYADQHGMQIYLGLHLEKDWWVKWNDEDFLKSAAKKNLKFAEQVSQRYSKHKSFSGWYIPFEMSDIDFDRNEVSSLNSFLKTVSYGLKKTTQKKLPVSVSVFFQGQIPAAVVAKNYTQILNQSGIDILMVQDGVGTNNWTVSLKEKVAPYLRAYRTAAQANKIRVWSVVESFSTLKDAAGANLGRAPADILRMKEQMQFHESQRLEKTLTFDFFHYMSPARGEAQSKLYKDYLTEVKGMKK